MTNIKFIYISFSLTHPHSVSGNREREATHRRGVRESAFPYKVRCWVCKGVTKTSVWAGTPVLDLPRLVVRRLPARRPTPEPLSPKSRCRMEHLSVLAGRRYDNIHKASSSSLPRASLFTETKHDLPPHSRAPSCPLLLQPLRPSAPPQIVFV